MTTGVRIRPSRKTLQRMDSTGWSFASDQDDCEAMGWAVVKMFIRAIEDKSRLFLSARRDQAESRSRRAHWKLSDWGGDHAAAAVWAGAFSERNIWDSVEAIDFAVLSSAFWALVKVAAQDDALGQSCGFQVFDPLEMLSVKQEHTGGDFRCPGVCLCRRKPG